MNKKFHLTSNPRLQIRFSVLSVSILRHGSPHEPSTIQRPLPHKIEVPLLPALPFDSLPLTLQEIPGLFRVRGPEQAPPGPPTGPRRQHRAAPSGNPHGSHVPHHCGEQRASIRTRFVGVVSVHNEEKQLTHSHTASIWKKSEEKVRRSSLCKQGLGMEAGSFFFSFFLLFFLVSSFVFCFFFFCVTPCMQVETSRPVLGSGRVAGFFLVWRCFRF